MIDGYIKLYNEIVGSKISKDKVIDTPENVNVTYRYSDDGCYMFIMNFNNEPKQIKLPFEYSILSGELDKDTVAPYGCVILKKK